MRIRATQCSFTYNLSKKKTVLFHLLPARVPARVQPAPKVLLVKRSMLITIRYSPAPLPALFNIEGIFFIINTKGAFLSELKKILDFLNEMKRLLLINNR